MDFEAIPYNIHSPRIDNLNTAHKNVDYVWSLTNSSSSDGYRWRIVGGSLLLAGLAILPGGVKESDLDSN